MMRLLLVLGMIILPLSGALAYDGFSPLSGPETAIPSPVCALINFGFCPQPAPLAVVLPDPNAVAARPASIAPVHRRRTRAHRIDPAG